MSYINLLDIIYPIGSIYMSFESISPSEIIGGNWTAIENKVIRGSNNTNTGGFDTTSHFHWQTMGYDGSIYSATALDIANANKTDSSKAWVGNSTIMFLKRSIFSNPVVYDTVGAGRFDGTSSVGLNNLPAYQNLYIWHRVS